MVERWIRPRRQNRIDAGGEVGGVGTSLRSDLSSVSSILGLGWSVINLNGDTMAPHSPPGRLDPRPKTLSALRRAGKPDPSIPSEAGFIGASSSPNPSSFWSAVLHQPQLHRASIPVDPRTSTHWSEGRLGLVGRLEDVWGGVLVSSKLGRLERGRKWSRSRPAGR